jgi:hypothetical protein
MQPGQLDSDPFSLKTDPIVSRESEVRHHFHQIVTSRAFNRSRRSCEFLQYLVDKTLAGEHDELKERVIGVQLFGRDPSYDTGEDAIVRVTATDVRRRLKRFYDDAETSIRLDLFPGSYVIALNEQTVAPETVASIAEESPAPASPPQVETISQPAPGASGWRRYGPIAAMLLLMMLLFASWHFRTQAAKADRLPWSAMLPRQGQLKIVFSDPDIATIQGITGTQISLTDYADHHYVPAQPMLDHPSAVVEKLFKGYNVPIIDADFALGVRGLLPSSLINTYRARALQSQDFKTEDNFILLGSPLSDPWLALFEDRLDFYFKYDPVRHEEVVYNRRPEHGEAPAYAPTIPGWGTGQAFAIIGLLANQNQTGNILVLAGSNSVATEAAFRLVTDVDSIARVLQEHGIDPHDRNAHFEILLRVNTMASSLNTFDVVACHHLDAPAH